MCGGPSTHERQDVLQATGFGVHLLVCVGQHLMQAVQSVLRARGPTLKKLESKSISE